MDLYTWFIRLRLEESFYLEVEEFCELLVPTEFLEPSYIGFCYSPPISRSYWSL
jgi:hypothetical protein